MCCIKKKILLDDLNKRVTFFLKTVFNPKIKVFLKYALNNVNLE